MDLRFDLPEPRSDARSMLAHSRLLEKKAQGRIDAYFLGDSITRRWGATDYPDLLEHWKASFHGWHAANFGWGGDGVQHILWRVMNGELDGVHPKLLLLQAGTNNISAEASARGEEEQALAILGGLKALRREMRDRAPGAALVQVGLFPRNDLPAAAGIISRVNQGLAALATEGQFRYLEINRELSDSAGNLRHDFSADGLHLIREGYEVWARALRPLLLELLGPPAAKDLAPPPTGIPSTETPG